MARIKDVVIKPGKKAIYEAPLRKPLVFVGSGMPLESASGITRRRCRSSTRCRRWIWPNAPGAPTMPGGMTAGATTWDGRYLVVAQGNALTAFDNGTGKLAAGTITLAAAPTRVVVAPRDQAIVALNPASGTDGSITIISDVAGFVGSPGSVNPKVVSMPGQVARTAAFSPDGSKLYVLTGGMSVDPCAPGATLAANQIQIYGLDGSMTGQFALEGFAADVTVDPQSGTIVIADVAGKQVATLDPTSGAPTKLLGSLTCPSAVRVVNGTVFAVTSDRDMTANAFTLQRVPLKGGAAAATLFSGPNYNIPIDSMPSGNGDIGMALLPVRPVSIDAYELAVTPDGSRLEFATRAVYNESGTKFVFSGENCTANFNIVEYGLFAVDLHTGNAAYESRAHSRDEGSQRLRRLRDWLTVPRSSGWACQSTAGDKPVGLTATFGQ